MEQQRVNAYCDQLEGLSTVFVGPLDESEAPTRAVVLLHGFGASGTDLVPCAPELLSLGGDRLSRVVFVFPEAPMDLAEEGIPGGRAWWPINMARLMDLHQVENFGQLSSVVPDELPAESERMERFLDAVANRFGLSNGEIFLGGFSQGAMLSCDVALRLQGHLAGLILWSGTLIAEQRWADFGSADQPLKIVQSHGRMDDVLPFFAAEKLRDFLLQQGHQVQFIPFDGFHQTHAEALQATVDLIMGRES